MRFEQDGDILGSSVVTMGTSVRKDVGVGRPRMCSGDRETSGHVDKWDQGKRRMNDLCSES